MAEATNDKPIGAALVVGGGIAGVQASLDLAESGIKVYLLEKSPAIGGKMAQLDKTFPTNDCAMCISSPKLVEAGRHHNIEIITTAELTALAGEAGNFTATLRCRPRYIDIDKCTSCNDCAEVCPIHVPSEFNEGLCERTATFRPYAQAVPNAYAITKRGMAPCRDACPINQRAQGYIALIRQQRYEDAYRVIKLDNPFPRTLGRVCNHQCENNCTRGSFDEPVSICTLKRFVADRQFDATPLPRPERIYEEEIAIIGSGPAGLSAAHYLALMGYGVTVFEMLPVAGGMMRVGIPAYRLPREVLEQEINDVRKLGVDIRLNAPIRDIDGLFRDGYKAVFLAIGAHQPQELGIPGEDSRGVYHGVTFLRQVALGEGIDMKEKVVVIGGGNTAIDAARTAVRLGAKEVTIVYRRSRQEMRANPEEVEAALGEGIKIEFFAAPLAINCDGDRACGLRAIRTRLGDPDESGRRAPVIIPGSEFDIEADTVIAAVHQTPGLAFLLEGHGLRISERGTLEVDPSTLATVRPGVFAGGDVVTGPRALVEAVAHGKQAARSIHRYLHGEDTSLVDEPKTAVAKPSLEELATRLRRGEISHAPRQHAPNLPLSERSLFREVELGFSEEQALAEAERCLQCGICSECLECFRVCKAQAVDHNQVEIYRELKVGAVVLAPGYSLYNPEAAPEYGYGRYANVVTAMQFERMLSASGPTAGHVARPSDHEEPRRIAFLQCVGSRDQNHDYCSSVCCMYATKEAMLAMEHVPGVECHVFMMDMRAFGKGFDAYFERGKEKGIRYHRCRLSSLKEDHETKDLLFTYTTDNGDLHQARFDLVVLSVGMEAPADVRRLAGDVGVDLDQWGFCARQPFKPVESSRPGVYVCGAFAEPKDIPDSVTEASGAAAAALGLIGPARGTLITEKAYPPEIPVSDEDEPRIGAFICSCGSNIAGVVDVAAVTEYALTLPGVVHAENTIYTCAADSLKLIQQRVQELGLNRVVVASCTPRTHEPIFRETIREVGLNPYLFELANIRDQCSWVHATEPDKATQKAKDLVRMAVARSRLLEPLHTEPVGLTHAALVIGGGVAGMTAALNLADQGFSVYLVEREAQLGGRMRRIYETVEGGNPQSYLHELTERITNHERIEVLTGSQVVKTGGFVGNFKTTVASVDDPTQRLIEHGVTIVATGGQEYRGPAFGLGEDERIVTLGDLEQRLHQLPGDVAQAQNVVFLQCVGPWNEPGDDRPDFYCSRICCSVAMKNAMRIKEINPQANVYVLYRDVRTYGFKERLYTEARRKGVVFLHYDEDRPPVVETGNGQLRVSVDEPVLDTTLILTPDLLVLSEAVVPADGARDLAELMKFSCTLEGFFLEAHIKLRPVDFPAEGLFLAGVAHYPKLVDETIAQAQAAAARAATILSKEALEVGGVVAVVEPEKCTACLTCVRICPYDAPRINPELVGTGAIKGAAEIPAAACQGCGLCVAECPAKAIQLMHYRDEQVLAKEEALFVMG